VLISLVEAGPSRVHRGTPRPLVEQWRGVERGEEERSVLEEHVSRKLGCLRVSSAPDHYLRRSVDGSKGLQSAHSCCPATAGPLDGLYNLMAFAVSASSAPPTSPANQLGSPMSSPTSSTANTTPLQRLLDALLTLSTPTRP
jgi:hypothetical protein